VLPAPAVLSFQEDKMTAPDEDPDATQPFLPFGGKDEDNAQVEDVGKP
jgi:hypothetical protein